jgi:hypothetical protein
MDKTRVLSEYLGSETLCRRRLAVGFDRRRVCYHPTTTRVRRRTFENVSTSFSVGPTTWETKHKKKKPTEKNTETKWTV